ncbi:hypothetical protein OIM93_06730 [Clostridium chauvoei]|uniref:CbiQ family ECF transporter T component n=1 Tax=Clostridium chauvoei TaxID=46867 RepID=UPI00207A4FB0|nr:CbiQ family ECF transporter T component [Clostridium chauvoei]
MIREINLYSLNSKYSYIHPIEKLILVLISLTVCSYIENPYIIFLNIVFFIVLNLIARNPIRIINKFLSIAIFFSIFTTISLIWQGNSINYIIILILRGINGALSISFLSLTTPINQIVYIIGKFEYTRDVADIIKSMERFIIVLEDDFKITFNAIKARGGFSGIKSSIKDFGKALGVSFKNLIFRWREINLALKNRCYVGKHNYSYNFKISKLRLSYLLIYIVLLGFINIL